MMLVVRYGVISTRCALITETVENLKNKTVREGRVHESTVADPMLRNNSVSLSARRTSPFNPESRVGFEASRGPVDFRNRKQNHIK